MRPQDEQLLATARDWFDRDDQVEHYRAEAAHGPTPLESRVLNRFPAPPADVLDVGCGAGRIAVPLARQGYRVTGTDVSRRMLDEARAWATAAGTRVSLVQVSGTEMPFTAASFDAILSCKQYGYLPGADLRKNYLTRLWELLRPGGILALTSHVVSSEAEARAALDGDAEHRAAAARFDALEPLDTFSAGAGFVHWFTRDQLLDEIAVLAEPEVLESDGLQLGFVLRR
ncbi:2-polyprenyl-3-methyl-5-hydroxy-6-metoxy-1,4-benzoquinol methylase [Friedmanniella endophytica]|uniref:2-polyprenyl-3-methyl-5-hydroxy-6-metoxy-1, 4-benzoquinol methylase n=1 Tax=Microlunatus kandeliicorticis TaxID=1759536 RepID=A0A7W3P463_9ACTN|nr:class I SAM-dependent methyltransferase [Microlunatus kandeliicorticis]MBA8792525.1 2-polyprenyl-3-methyl-5-hydroxy-6-metoxy-1,4-benzoquinol methylase [Microlunatus kandeliicorticis]